MRCGWLSAALEAKPACTHSYTKIESSTLQALCPVSRLLVTPPDSSAMCSKVLLEAALEAPDEVAADLSMLSADEADQLLRGFNATEAHAPADKTLSQLFEAQAAAKPQAVCLLNGEHRLTYAEVSYPESNYQALLVVE